MPFRQVINSSPALAGHPARVKGTTPRATLWWSRMLLPVKHAESGEHGDGAVAVWLVGPSRII